MGSFELAVRGLPLRSLSLWCRAEGWQTERAGPFDCRTGGAAGIDFALERPIPWRGRVVALPDGRPVAGATIRVGNRLGSFSALGGGCESDEGGVFDLPLPSCPIEGAWILVTAPGFAPQALRGAKPGGGLVLALRERLTLEGVVATRDGQAMEGAAVRVAFDGLSPADDAELTDAAESTASGAFTLELASAPLDSATIRVEAEGCVRFEAPLADVVEAAGQNRLRARIRLTPSR
ncbi:MAG: carboxypeptidase regulatory-like domain-containing protein [Planctomycetes bacterium]|nr:carboxypeptidase regulatory-like domain-containing protein [Planctomycetota bacterium]